jgi:hypothetical protein
MFGHINIWENIGGFGSRNNSRMGKKVSPDASTSK